MSSDEEDDRPFFAEEIVGWRGWTTDSKGLLYSINDGALWTPGQEMIAVCNLGRTHKHVPWPNCQCGIYSTKTLQKLRLNGYHHHGVFGMISGWGEFVDGGEGYRVQFAYPRVIYVPYLGWRSVEPLRHYGVPVKLLNPHTGVPDPNDADLINEQ